MRKYLRHDAPTGELRLVYDDLWRGQHERTEYRVTDRRERGHKIRNRPELDGRPVSGVAPDLYLPGPLGGRSMVWTEPVAVGPTVKTPCARALHAGQARGQAARAKCALCAELAA